MALLGIYGLIGAYEGVIAPPASNVILNMAASENGEMDLFYQNIDAEFRRNVVDQNGDPVDLSIFNGAEYCIFDRLGNKEVTLSLNSGVSKDGSEFVITLADTNLNFSGLRQHQLVGIRADGWRDLIFKRRLTVVETCV